MRIFTTAPRSLDYPDTVDRGVAGVAGRLRIPVRMVEGTQGQRELYQAFFSPDCSDFELAADKPGFALLVKQRVCRRVAT